jgi:hypothetical protein
VRPGGREPLQKNGGAWSAAGELIWTEFKPFKMFLAEHGSRRAMSGLVLLCSSKLQRFERIGSG